MAAGHPEIGFTYLEAEPPEAVAAVRDDRVDLAITFSYPGDRDDPHPGSAQGLRHVALCTDEMLLVLPTGHPAAAAEQVDLAGLADENWIGGCPRCRGHLLELCDQSGFVPRISYETDNVAAVLGLVAAGIGVAMLPRWRSGRRSGRRRRWPESKSGRRELANTARCMRSRRSAASGCRLSRQRWSARCADRMWFGRLNMPRLRAATTGPKRPIV